MTSSMASQGGLKVSLYIHVKERLTPGANCKGNVLSINANIIIVFLCFTCQKRSQWITLFDIASQRSTSQAYWVTMALISNIANYLKYNYFWDCDDIDNVTLRLWKFSDFCSRHTVGVAGDDIMFHILVHLWHQLVVFPVTEFNELRTRKSNNKTFKFHFAQAAWCLTTENFFSALQWRHKSTTASLITGNLIVCLTVCPGQKTPKVPHHWLLARGIHPVHGRSHLNGLFQG